MEAEMFFNKYKNSISNYKDFSFIIDEDTSIIYKKKKYDYLKIVLLQFIF